MSDWSLDQARRMYSVAHWSDGYVDIDSNGRATMRPQGEPGPTIALDEAVKRSKEIGARLPLLLRFPDILLDRRAKLRAAFMEAMREHDYRGGYTALYPIKVNQQRAVAGTLAGGEGFGLEAGSKPE
ncbi:MAG: arginine decarboxylase, partial [Rhodanobacteraceae bacterium]